jgi:hypothetical protein
MIEICEKLKIGKLRTKLKEIGKLKDNKMWRNWDKKAEIG